jgi:hydroxyethylthiazole kinase
MIKSGKIANQLNHPVVLDPVGVGASQLRKQTAFYLLENIHFSVIKGNISEIKVLASHTGIVKGVDAAIEDKVTEENLENTISFIKKLAKKMNCIIVASGEIDLVSDNQRCFVIRNGESKMSSITGTGCQLSALITSYISANKERMLEATVAAVCTMGLAGEIGKKHLLSYEGNATYRNRIIDAVDHMDEKILEEGAKYEIR